MKRLWRSLLFALGALRFYWRHGDGAVLKLETTELRPISTEILPTKPDPVPEAVEPPLAPQPMEADVVLRAPFRVVREGGQVCYEGASGGTARRCIESLRIEGVQWRADRYGQRWDWGPR